MSLISLQFNSKDPKFRPLPPHITKQLHNQKKKLRFLLRNTKKETLRSNKIFNTVYLINTDGQDYLDKQVPPLLSDLHRKVLKDKMPTGVNLGKSYFVGGFPMMINRGQHYIYLKQEPRILSESFFRFVLRDFSAKLLTIGFLVSLPFSLFFAWMVVSPIRRLQKSTKKLKKNLSQTEDLIQLSDRRDEFAELAKDIKHFATHIERLINSKNRLLSDVSHELRSPLARQKIAIALAEGNPHKDDKSIARVKLEGERLEAMISSLLDYSKWDESISHFDTAKFRFKSITFNTCRGC